MVRLLHGGALSQTSVCDIARGQHEVLSQEANGDLKEEVRAKGVLNHLEDCILGWATGFRDTWRIFLKPKPYTLQTLYTPYTHYGLYNPNITLI